MTTTSTPTCNFRASMATTQNSHNKIKVATYQAVISSAKHSWNLGKKNLRKPFIASSMNGPLKAEDRGLIWMINHPPPSFQFPFQLLLMILQLSIQQPNEVMNYNCKSLFLFFFFIMGSSVARELFMTCIFCFCRWLSLAFNSGVLQSLYLNQRPIMYLHGGVHIMLWFVRSLFNCSPFFHLFSKCCWSWFVFPWRDPMCLCASICFQCCVLSTLSFCVLCGLS